MVDVHARRSVFVSRLSKARDTRFDHDGQRLPNLVNCLSTAKMVTSNTALYPKCAFNLYYKLVENKKTEEIFAMSL
jgi:hypothetical protein